MKEKTIQISVSLMYDLLLYFDESGLGKTPDREERIRHELAEKADRMYKRDQYMKTISDSKA